MSVSHKAREAAFRMLFQWEMSKDPAERVKSAYAYLDNTKPPPKVREKAGRLFDGAVGRVAEIDPLIRRSAEHWRLERMSAVDRNILRLAVYEFLAGKTPPKVIINEAILIAHRYSSDDAAGFINGVLDAVRKSTAGDAKAGS
jgi:N utilization substance protein B